ncbi:hypothetical protein [Planococcus sp. YIM B11945]|uniref:hypothetical protein n=1 Tax=Planococcus sp. YIM B11945 TaxID=3435410 RepID=UPI003D7E614D
MSLRRLLIHLCTIVTPGQKVGENAYGKPIYKDVITNDVPCRVDQIKQAVTSDPYGTDFITKNLLVLGPEQTFLETSRFSDIRDKKGNPVLEGSFGIESSKPAYGRRSLHHHEITLKKESGANA